MQFPWVRKTDNIYSFFSFFSMIYTIATLIQQPMTLENVLIFVGYVVVVALTQLTLLFLSILIVLLPLICFIGCFYYCFCFSNKGKASYIDLPSKQATNQDIANAGGMCAICRQDYNMGDKIYILPCS